MSELLGLFFKRLTVLCPLGNTLCPNFIVTSLASAEFRDMSCFELGDTTIEVLADTPDEPTANHFYTQQVEQAAFIQASYVFWFEVVVGFFFVTTPNSDMPMTDELCEGWCGYNFNKVHRFRSVIADRRGKNVLCMI